MRFIHDPNLRNPKIVRSLNVSEIEKTEKYWIKQTQETTFKDEIEAHKKKNT